MGEMSDCLKYSAAFAVDGGLCEFKDAWWARHKMMPACSLIIFHEFTIK